MNQASSFWRNMTEFMLTKFGLIQGFRFCFADLLRDFPYTIEEIPELIPAETDKPANETAPPASPEARAVQHHRESQAAQVAPQVQELNEAVGDGKIPYTLNPSIAQPYSEEQHKLLLELLDHEYFPDNFRARFKESLNAGSFEFERAKNIIHRLNGVFAWLANLRPALALPFGDQKADRIVHFVKELPAADIDRLYPMTSTDVARNVEAMMSGHRV
jgi:hypothetical protein